MSQAPAAATASGPAPRPDSSPAITLAPTGTNAGPTGGPTAGPAGRTKARHPRYPLMNQLNADQVGSFRAIAVTYIPDMYDPAAVEVLLLLLEVCHILDLAPAVVTQIFGTCVLAVLDTWGDLIPPRRRPATVRRAWVWLPNQRRPRLYPIDDDGTIRVHEA